MKLKELKGVLRSTRGNVQVAIVYDSKKHADIESGCSIDYAVKTYGERELKRIEAYGDELVIIL